MSYDDHEDLFSGDFDFVDEDELDDSSADLLSSERDDSSDRDSSDTDQDDSELEFVDDPSDIDDPSNVDDPSDIEAGPAPEAEPDKQQPEARPKTKRNTRHRKRAQETSAEGSTASGKTEGDDQNKPDSEIRKESDPTDLDAVASKPEVVEEPPKPPADHVVHIYELGQFKRTIQREFTEPDAEAFATQYNITAKPYNRKAIAVAREEEPATTID
jgi:hypothetical protein